MTNTFTLQKVVRLGTSKTYRGRGFSTYALIEIKGGELYISGVEGPLKNGNCLGGCGQIEMSRSEIIELAPGWTREKLAGFWEIWHRWHLNHLTAGCQHQRDFGWTYQEHHDPNTSKGEACPICGYEIGSQWLKEELPEYVIAFLTSLPETDRQPAWV